MKNHEKVINKYLSKQETESYIKKRYRNSFFELENEIQKKLINRLIKNNFLEIAPGTGRVSNHLPTSIKEGTLVDSSAEMISLLKRQSRFKIINTDFFKLKTKKKFDFAFSFRFLRHLNKVERQAALKKINYLLKKDSLLIFEAFNKRYSLVNSIFKRKSVYDKYFSINQIKKELDLNGFLVKAIIPLYKVYPLQRILYILIKRFSQKAAINTVKNIDNKINRSDLALEWLVIAKKAR